VQALGEARQAARAQARAGDQRRDAQVLRLAEELLGHLGHLAPVGLLGADQLVGLGVERAGRAGRQALELGDVRVFEVRAGGFVIRDRARQGVDVEQLRVSSSGSA